MLNKEIMAKLSEPFPSDKIKKRKGRGGSVEYIEFDEIVCRLNDVLEGCWSFTIESERETAGFIIVLGKMEIDGICKMQYGRKKITLDKQKEVVDPGDDSKAAASDALKKCASLFGVNLGMYMNDEHQNQGQPLPQSQGQRPTQDQNSPAHSDSQVNKANQNSDIGTVKNDILAKENVLSEKYKLSRASMRKDALGNESLSHTMDALRKYYERLEQEEIKFTGTES